MKAKSSLLVLTVLFLILSSCHHSSSENSASGSSDVIRDTLLSIRQINAMLDSFNVSAAEADYLRYFSYFNEDAIFIGTDATEHWNKGAFMIWAKPYFDQKKTWNFKSLERHIYFNKSGDMAWFDELLNTQMKICRGSGVVVKQNDGWKLEQYVLSTTIPNRDLNAVIKIKGPVEDSLIQQLSVH